MVANARVHGTTHRAPWEMLAEERPHRYGVHWKWVGYTVQVGQRLDTVEIWAGDERIAVHPRAQQPGQRFILPGQRSGLPRGDSRPRKEAVAVQIPAGEVDRRSLDVYELVAGGVA